MSAITWLALGIGYICVGCVLTGVGLSVAKTRNSSYEALFIYILLWPLGVSIVVAGVVLALCYGIGRCIGKGLGLK
jgi:ABC-type sulfate transport system permease subunit